MSTEFGLSTGSTDGNFGSTTAGGTSASSWEAQVASLESAYDDATAKNMYLQEMTIRKGLELGAAKKTVQPA